MSRTPLPTNVFAGGLREPTITTPPRRPGSMRRTSHVDMLRTAEGELALAGAARDLHTEASGTIVVAAATVEARLDPAQRLVQLTTEPFDVRTEPLVGLVVARGFRAALDEALPAHRRASTPLYLLLDDLPVAALISGYARLYSDDLDADAKDTRMVKGDICAGWRTDGTMMVSLARTGAMPVPVGPPAPEITPPEDPMAWHALAPLAPGAMRRRRLLDVTPGSAPDERAEVFAMFRDTYVDADGEQTVLHEYSLTASLDPATLVLTDVRATPQVLPWTECPAAAASATRLDGQAVTAVPDLVRQEFRGTSTCTHLNDLLRSLAHLRALVG